MVFEIMNEGKATAASSYRGEAMACEARSVADGRREAKDIRVETYSNETGTHKGLFKKSVTGKREGKKEDKKKAIDQKIGTISFVSGNPFVETTRGILHLYKENILSTLESGSERCNIICILAVPATMTCHDLLNFTAAYHDDIKHLRIIKDGTPNQYMALLTFRSQEMVCEFYTSFNGAPFNSLEPDCVCNLVFVSGVKVEESHPQLPPGHTELPTCPVCLERMDESVDGILTILCNHNFHSNCLAKWGDTSCPVCRYVQTPELVADNRCLQCVSVENLWICLICGHVGCGRYVEGHAYKHYLATQHCYSMLLGTNRVWDYAGDNFVHRLLQNKGDGKLVEAEQPSKEPGMEEKMESLQLEWTYNLTMQLEKQKDYFEGKIGQLQQSFASESTELRQKLLKTTEENHQLQVLLNEANIEKLNLEKKINTLSSRLGSTLSQLQDEKQIGKALQQNQTVWQAKFTNLESQFKDFKEMKDQELSELKDQLRDVMFFLEAQKQIEASDAKDEIAEGKIVISERPKNGSGLNSGKQRRRKNR
ncbi:hypothetical protein RUM43_003737 [Polyplax serrata]|uniref:BRCA1-associated protein n=1 Tax=Polyplax serrata TaxID=468196 RepID=A0AAN8S9G1_POLSC